MDGQQFGVKKEAAWVTACAETSGRPLSVTW